MNARRVDPAIVEIEQRANGDCVVERFIGPARAARLVNIGAGDLIGSAIDLGEEFEQCLLGIGNRRRRVIREDGTNLLGVCKQLRRDRGVRADSKHALVAVGGEGRDQLALPGRERRGPTH